VRIHGAQHYGKVFLSKIILNTEIFGRMRGAFPACLEDFLFAVRDGSEPHVTAADG
jgi:hypothetical protein